MRLNGDSQISQPAKRSHRGTIPTLIQIDTSANLLEDSVCPLSFTAITVIAYRVTGLHEDVHKRMKPMR